MTDQNPETDNSGERPEWLPEKFQSPEELAKSYQELERQFTQSREHTKALEENYASLSNQFEEWTQAQQVPAVPQYDPADAQAQLWAQYEADPLSTIAAIANAAAQQAAATALQQAQPQSERQAEALRDLVVGRTLDGLRAEYADFSDYEQEAGEIIRTNPLFKDVDATDPAAVRAAYDLAYKAARQQNPQPEQTGFDVAAMKRAAQTATGGNPRPDSAPPDPWAAIASAKPSSYSDLMGRTQR